MNISVNLTSGKYQGFHSEITDSEIRHMYLHPEDIAGSPYYNYSYEQIENLYMRRVYPNLTESEREQDRSMKK